MKKILLCWLAAATALTAGAQSNEWQDAGVNAVNRMPMHGSWFAYESPEAAQTGDKTLSERFVTLNGNWKFNWVRDADQRPTDFFRVGYNDKGWNDMPVPGLWELNGTANPYCSFCSASSRLALTFSAISKLILLWSRSALLRGVV